MATQLAKFLMTQNISQNQAWQLQTTCCQEACRVKGIPWIFSAKSAKWLWVKRYTFTTLLVVAIGKQKINKNLWSLELFFLTQSQMMPNVKIRLGVPLNLIQVKCKIISNKLLCYLQAQPNITKTQNLTSTTNHKKLPQK